MAIAVSAPTQIVKRSGEVVEFDSYKIRQALRKCFDSEDVVTTRGNRISEHDIWRICTYVLNALSVRFEDTIPTVEDIQNTVEFVLQTTGEYAAAKHYILYRAERTRIRNENNVPQEIIDLFELDKQYFKFEDGSDNHLSYWQFLDKYSGFNYGVMRRETWMETVDRTVSFLKELAENQKPGFVAKYEATFNELREAILTRNVMPSMRLMAMAGPAARRDNAVLYNCSYLPLDSLTSFFELMSNSMAGCGVGYSVEKRYVDCLPIVQRQKESVFKKPFTVKDTAEGWCEALYHGLCAWFDGKDIDYNFSEIREAGAVLKTKGGRASGPEPLQKMLAQIRERILSKQGSKLTPIDAHDIACMIGGAVVSGGVRRTAMISLFDIDDQEMLTCKSGDFERKHKYRWNANNSAVWTDTATITQQQFLRRMWPMFEGERGEPGIFSRDVAINMMPTRRDKNHTFGTNPCGEIILRPYQFCNLSSVVVKENDTRDTLERKVYLATFVGTIQSTATYFPNLRPIWKQNCDEERLLGVDISGQLDNKDLLEKEDVFQTCKEIVIHANAEFAHNLGINVSAATTCVKPNGNSSVLVDSSSGIHPRWANYYIRNVRIGATSALLKILQDAGYPVSPENGSEGVPTTYVVGFPVKAPKNAIVRDKLIAIQQCEWWLKNKVEWTEHNPSVTIYYRPNEVLHLLDWLWKHIHLIGGMSFLPYSDAKYDQLPYVEITEQEYLERKSKIPEKISWYNVYRYEKEDHTNAAQTLACEGPICDLPIPIDV